jgi:hypothetical protein
MIIAALRVEARIGESVSEIEARYGKPVSKLKDCWQYKKGEIKVSVFYDRIPYGADLEKVEIKKPIVKEKIIRMTEKSTPSEKYAKKSTVNLTIPEGAPDPREAVSIREIYETTKGEFSDVAIKALLEVNKGESQWLSDDVAVKVFTPVVMSNSKPFQSIGYKTKDSSRSATLSMPNILTVWMNTTETSGF